MINHRFGIHLVEIYRQMLKLKLNEGYMEVHHAFRFIFTYVGKFCVYRGSFNELLKSSKINGKNDQI